MQLKWPYQWDKDGTHNDNQCIQWQAQFKVIAETITAGAINQEVGLVADRSSKTSAGAKTDTDYKRFGSHP